MFTSLILPPPHCFLDRRGLGLKPFVCTKCYFQPRFEGGGIPPAGTAPPYTDSGIQGSQAEKHTKEHNAYFRATILHNSKTDMSHAKVYLLNLFHVLPSYNNNRCVIYLEFVE